MKIKVACPLCNKEASGDIPDDMGKKKGLSDGQTVTIPCPDCLNSKMVGAVAGATANVSSTWLKDITGLTAQVEATRKYHKNKLVKDKEVKPMLFAIKGEELHMFMLDSVLDDKDKAEACIKAILEETEPDSYFMVTEAWQGTKLDVMPAQDPDRKEILLVFGQQRGAPGIMDYTPFTKFDGEIRFTGPSNMVGSTEMQGRFINLLPSE